MSHQKGLLKSQDLKGYAPPTPNLQILNLFMQFGPSLFSLCDPRAANAPLIMLEKE